MPTFTVVEPSAFIHFDVCQEEELVIVEYRGDKCYHSSYAVMQQDINSWIIPTLVSAEPTLESVENTLMYISRGRVMATRLQLRISNARQLLELGSTIYNMIDDIVNP